MESSIALYQSLNCGSVFRSSVKSLNRRINAPSSRSFFIRALSQKDENRKEEPIQISSSESMKETRLHSIAALPIYSIAAAEGLRASLEPVGEIIRGLNLPEWLVHWGHPGNMAVVLFAMGGYGSYLGWQIRLATEPEVKLMAKDMHPKLLAGMFFFFALGATGGVTSLVTSGRPILDSPHAISGITGLALLTLQSVLTTKFEGQPEFRSIHAYLGSSIMALFLVHAALGLQLGLSF